MKIQGINFLGFRPIKEVNEYGNNGNSTVEEVDVIYRKSNYKYDNKNNLILSEPVFEEFRIPKVAVVDILDNYQLSKETRDVLEKYCKKDNDEDLVLQIKKGKRKLWYLHLSILDTAKFTLVVGLLIALLAVALTL